MPTTTQAASQCRTCHATCPLTVTLEDGRPTTVVGNRNSPTYQGYCCTRGQATTEALFHPDRLLHSQRRAADGSYGPIGSDQLMDEVSEKIARIVAEHGPGSVAIYFGTMSGTLGAGAAASWLTALGSHHIYSSMTIDQPGKLIAAAMLGGWEAGSHGFSDADTWLIIGGNPMVTIGGALPAPNSPRRLVEAVNRGMKLIVIDPRETETARRAHIHLRPIPGNDAAIIAAMIRVILDEGLHDSAFVADHVTGFAELAAALAGIDPAVVAERAGLSPESLADAARTFAKARRGIAIGSTGANMSGRSTLTEYLTLVLNTLCGRYVRAGEAIDNPGVLMTPAMPRAQPVAPVPALYPKAAMSARGLCGSAAGMPTAALADEILSGRIKALFSVGGSPVVAWPDQDLTIAALQALDLYVQVDVRMTPSALLADYVMAPTVSFEVPSTSYTIERLELYFGAWGMPEPFGMYVPKLVDPPAGSDVIDEWAFFWGLARRMGLQLKLGEAPTYSGVRRQPRPPARVPMDRQPTTDELLELILQGSRVPLAEVKRHPDGAVFPGTVITEPADPACTARLQVGEPGMLAELGELAAELQAAPRVDLPAGKFLMVSRRAAHLNNSTGLDLPRLMRKGGTTNPAYIHPEDLAALGLAAGDAVEVISAHGAIPALVEPDASLLRGLVSMTHAFGRLPSEKADFRRFGSNTSRLTSVSDDYDKWSGIPRMSAVPVTIRPLPGA